MPLFAKDWKDYELKGKVASVENVRATYRFEFGKWGLSDFFPYSNRISSVADLIFDRQGKCTSENYLLPSGKSRYQVALTHQAKANETILSSIAFDYLSNEGEKNEYYYNSEEKLIRKILYGAEYKVLQTRYYEYENNQLIKEDAYGETNQHYEQVRYQYHPNGLLAERKVVLFPYNMQISKILYKYDDLGRLIEKISYQFDGILQQTNKFSYNDENLVVQELIYCYDTRENVPQIYQYHWDSDEHGNWIQKIVVELVKVHNRWVEKPLFIHCRNIIYN